MTKWAISNLHHNYNSDKDFIVKQDMEMAILTRTTKYITSTFYTRCAIEAWWNEHPTKNYIVS